MELNALSIAFLVLGASCTIIAGFLLWQEIGEVNRKLPDDEQISYLGIYAEKMARIKREYNRLYPNGRTDRGRVAFQITGFAFLFLAAIAAGFFRHWPVR